MNSNSSEKSGMGGGQSSFSERLAGMFREAGKAEKRIVFLCMWVTRFGKFIAPRRYHEAGAAEVEAFLRSLVAAEGELADYAWSSFPQYLKPPRQRAEWLRVDRLLGELGIRRDNAAGRRELRELMEGRRGARL